jgi:N-acetylglucosamine malate deacetylase 1
MKNVLVVGAHPDDLEWMAGGTVANVIAQGGKVHLLTFTNGTWKDADGNYYRDKQVAINEATIAAKVLGYSLEHLDEPCLDVTFRDSLVVKVLEKIDKINADTIICPWIDDLHRDHEMTARIAISASRRVPRVLMGMCNWYVFRTPFNPNFFVDISETYHKKMEALECYKSEMARIGTTWRKYHDNITSNYGLMVNTNRAEGFISYKYKL